MSYLSSSLILGGEIPQIRTSIQRTKHTVGPVRALGAVDLGSLTVQTSGDPQVLRDIAHAFSTVANLMDEENARIASETETAA